LAYVDAAFVGVGVTEKFASKSVPVLAKLESKVAVPVDGHFVFLERDSKPKSMKNLTKTILAVLAAGLVSSALCTHEA
jgi:hypothetical protein